MKLNKRYRNYDQEIKRYGRKNAIGHIERTRAEDSMERLDQLLEGRENGQ